MAGFLGSDISYNEDEAMTMPQTGLIDRIITALGLDDANTKETPARLGTLSKDLKGARYNANLITQA